MTDATAKLEWTYQPADLLRDAQIFEAYGGYLVIQDGVASAEINEVHFRADSALPEKLLRTIRARLAPFEHQSTRPLVLNTRPSLTIRHHDGRPSEIYLESHANIRVTDSLDIQIYRNGVLIEDSARDRQKNNQSEAELLSKHAEDDLLSRLLESHSASKRAPRDEFTHLYEILEALQSSFGKPPRITEALGLQKPKVGKFHAVCNDPTTVSRHRGQTKGPLREPTAEELNFARAFAWEMILSYVTWLDHRSL